MNRNSTQHVEIRFADGEIRTRSYRNSTGGFARFMDRIAADAGVARVELEERLVAPNGEERFCWNVGGRIFTLEPVNRL